MTKDHKVVAIDDFFSPKTCKDFDRDEGKYCKDHNEEVVYFCETEMRQVCAQCINLKTCEPTDKRIPVQDAAKNHITTIKRLIMNCESSKKDFEHALETTKKVAKDFVDAKKTSATST